MWQIIGISFSIFFTLLNIIMFVIIRFNDLKHLELSVKDLKDMISKHGDKVDSLGERISRMEGIISQKPRKIRKR